MVKKINESGSRKNVSDLYQPLKNIISFTDRFDTMLNSIRIDSENVLDNLSNIPDHFSARRKFDEIDTVINDMNAAFANLVKAGKELNELLLDTRNKYGNRNRTEGMSNNTKNFRTFGKKFTIKESEVIEEDTLNIDMWYGDSFNKEDYAVDCTFYPNDGEYRGNIYRLSDGKIVGDYSCSDSTVIEDRLGYDFD